jgi:hypothetical protein
VSYYPPAAGIPAGTPAPVSAAYSGDTTFSSSSATDQFISSGPPTGLANPNDPSVLDTVTCPASAAGAPAATRRHAARGPLARPANNATYVQYTDPTTGQTVKRAIGNCLAVLLGTGGRLVQLGGVIAGVAVGVGTTPVSGGAGVGLGLSIGGIGLVAGQGIVITADKIIHDPPDPHFRSLVHVARVAPVHIVAQRGLAAHTAQVLGRLLTEQRVVRATGQALASTIDRAGGARKAHNQRWLGAQSRALLADARTLAAQAVSVVGLLRSVSALAAQSSLLSRPVAAGAVAALKRRVAHGVPRTLANAVRGLGVSPASLRAAILSAPVAAVPASLAAYLASPLLAQSYRDLAGAAFLDQHDPDILAASHLR